MPINHQSEFISHGFCVACVLLGILYVSTGAIIFAYYTSRQSDLTVLRENIKNEFIVNDIKRIVQTVLNDIRDEHQPVFRMSERMSVFCHDQTSRFVFILSHGQRSRQYILPEDLALLVQDVVDTHPELAFLKEAAEFHSRYVHTVIARIFYTVNRSWSGRITIPELRRSNLLQVIQLLEEEEDINEIMAYFSYEHFYVIYCKFWELDRDHDLLIDQNDLGRHNDHGNREESPWSQKREVILKGFYS